MESGFQASHRVALANEADEPAHKHNWLARATVSSDKLDETGTGVVMDFCQLKRLLETITSQLNGVSLRQVGYFKRNGESAEYVAKYIYEALKPKIPAGVRLDSVTIVEEPGCIAGYSTD